jgi:hypothetical protein
MLELNFTLHTTDGHILDQTIRAEQPPRVGEVIGVDGARSYQVVDVLWHINAGLQGALEGLPGRTLSRLTVTACELNWRQHISDTVEQWRRQNGQHAVPAAYDWRGTE